MTNIHPMAIVDKDAQLGSDVTIGPFSIVQGDVLLGDGCTIGSHVFINSGSRLGKKCRVFKGAVVGTEPQDLKYANEKTTLEIGDNTTIREFCTLNRGTTHSMKTSIGSNCLLMAYVHIAHDCVIGDNVILANAVNLAGHVTIESFATVGGMTPIHQFARIGCYAFIGGGLRVSKDIPPYILAAGEPIKYAGVNRIGLSRKGFSEETMKEIRNAYKLLYRSRKNISQALAAMKELDSQIPEVKNITQFVESSKRGIIK